MKCPRCGADSHVLETRSFEHGQTLRQRECFNMHRYTTVEIYKACYGSARQRARTFMETIVRAKGLWDRNKDIADNMHRGPSFFMTKYGISRTTVFNALRAGRKGIPYTMASKVKAIISADIRTRWIK